MSLRSVESQSSFHSANANWPPPPRPPLPAALSPNSPPSMTDVLSPLSRSLPGTLSPLTHTCAANAIGGGAVCGPRGTYQFSSEHHNFCCSSQHLFFLPPLNTAAADSRFFRCLRMVLCCLCCPVYRSALWLCIFEIFASVLVWYNCLDFIVKTFEVLQLKDVLLFVILSGWLVTLFTSTGTLILAEKKKNAEYVLPRIVQQAGLLICGFLCAIMLVIYFSGGSSYINNVLLSIFEFIVMDKPMTREERREAFDTIRYGFMLLILLDFFFICYMSFGLAITRKYQKELERNYPITVNAGQRSYQAGQFKPLSQNPPPPSAPPPPYNC